MNPLLEQFLSETREALPSIGEKLMQLEQAPGDAGLMVELFRLVHTVKGNSGVFEYPEMSRVLHAGEDLMDAVRNVQVAYSQDLADQLLEAMDFVGLLCDEIESTGRIDASRAVDSASLAAALRALIPETQAVPEAASADAALPGGPTAAACAPLPLDEIPETARLEACRRAGNGDSMHWVAYTPAPECFFQGDDPFFTARQTPEVLWGRILPRESWPPLAELDAYRCVLEYQLLTAATREELAEYYRYVPDQVRIVAVELAPQEWRTAKNADAGTAAHSGSPAASLNKEDAAALEAVFAALRQIFMLDDHCAWQPGRLKAAAGVLVNCCKATGEQAGLGEIEECLQQALAAGSGAPLLAWLDARERRHPAAGVASARHDAPAADGAEPGAVAAPEPASNLAAPDEGSKFGRRAEDSTTGPKSLKVDQARIDLLMNLIGEMVVSKNALPYLAQRAEEQFGARELAREIKAQYAVINRIAEEMQGAIMKIRMTPVSFVFQRFPRLVRDLSRKLGKEVELVFEGEETEADKNIIESLADPLIHIVRNSLDHGLETPDVRRASGKPALGKLTIRALQEGDQVVIEIIDDGKGIDPAQIKRKAYEKGVLDEAALARISDRDAVNLVFAAGFSTVDVVSDVSGRGVGMDVVRTAVAKVNGTIVLESETGKGTRIRISLPLSMAVTKVMVVESDRQSFGIPMEHVVETVRVRRNAIRTIKRSKTIVLRGSIVPLKPLTELLALGAEPQTNADDELAVLVTRVGGEAVGLIVDDFRESVDVIQKPLGGVLSSIGAYSGSALMGDGSILMVLNLKEIV